MNEGTNVVAIPAVASVDIELSYEISPLNVN